MGAPQRAFLTTAEVKAAVGIQEHVLRFWESRFAYIRPARTGSGRRRWSHDDLAIVQGIATLLHRGGFTVRGVQKLIRERGIEALKAIGRGEAQVEVAPAAESRAEACFVLTYLPERARAALVAALSDPTRCRALAEQCLGQEKAA